MDEKTEPAAPKTNWWKENRHKLLWSLLPVGIYFAVLFLFESCIDNNSLATLLNGTATIGFVFGMLKIWVVKPADKSWFEASKGALDFWQAVLVVTVFLLLIYHAHVRNLIDNILPETVVFTGKVIENPSTVNIVDCSATLKFHDGNICTCTSDNNGQFNCECKGLSKKAVENEVIIALSHESYQNIDPFIGRVSNGIVNIKTRNLIKKTGLPNSK